MRSQALRGYIDTRNRVNANKKYPQEPLYTLLYDDEWDKMIVVMVIPHFLFIETFKQLVLNTFQGLIPNPIP